MDVGKLSTDAEGPGPEQAPFDAAASARTAAAVRPAWPAFSSTAPGTQTCSKIEVWGREAIVDTWRLPRGVARTELLEICEAALSFHRIREARVRVGERFVVGCS